MNSKLFFSLICVSLFCLLFLYGCNKEISKEQAIQIMKDSDCWWDLSEEGVKLKLDGDHWIMSINRCGGVCKVSARTGKFGMDKNPMCFGVLP